MARVVGNAGIVDIDGHALRRDFRAPAGQSQTDDERGLQPGQRLVERLHGRAEHARQLHGMHHTVRNQLAIQRARHLP
ncbi:hypothetical protein D3C77_771250 [compost metagenome]